LNNIHPPDCHWMRSVNCRNSCSFQSILKKLGFKRKCVLYSLLCSVNMFS
jgi:hypothetical protein